VFFIFKNLITESTSQSEWLVIGMVLFKALWGSNQLTQSLGKNWRRGRGSENSSRPSKASANYLREQGAQTFVTSNATLVYDDIYWFYRFLVVISFILWLYSENGI
jgi:hypothetical protein